MVDLNPETKTLAEIIGKNTGASLAGISDVVSALVGSRAISPRQGAAILDGIGKRADSAPLAELMKLKSARLMTQRRLKQVSVRKG
ncbi:hypothetical protein SAMN03159423_4503 [Bradyrhizobium sp. NFR13]|uniref:hypothetical protein n=1 Tax=Bradyrhizobium sp. NFR13 TaxID=1566285 RepID=UPI0008F38826|nr:hypothetical protein [Bradyrhizobium sp. NFR13]SFL93497.1 hypothetical protein SAMN03159423_4503 [Bradyrhizobium sp. NFR13]